MSKPVLAGMFCFSAFLNIVLMISWLSMKAERDAAIEDHINTIQKQKEFLDRVTHP